MCIQIDPCRDSGDSGIKDCETMRMVSLYLFRVSRTNLKEHQARLEKEDQARPEEKIRPGRKQMIRPNIFNIFIISLMFVLVYSLTLTDILKINSSHLPTRIRNHPVYGCPPVYGASLGGFLWKPLKAIFAATPSILRWPALGTSHAGSADVYICICIGNKIAYS